MVILCNPKTNRHQLGSLSLCSVSLKIFIGLFGASCTRKQEWSQSKKNIYFLFLDFEGHVNIWFESIGIWTIKNCKKKVWTAEKSEKENLDTRSGLWLPAGAKHNFFKFCLENFNLVNIFNWLNCTSISSLARPMLSKPIWGGSSPNVLSSPVLCSQYLWGALII